MGSATLAGLLLASSLPALASTQTTNIRPSMKSMLMASTIVSTGTYAKTVCKQLQWIPTQSNTNFVVSAQPTKTTQLTKSTQPANINTKPVQVATLQKQVSRSDSSELVDQALSLQGVPYVFGGTSRSGFDCSGYSQYVFRGSGIYLPRTASEQFNEGPQ